MQILIISDLHANWPALQAVLADAEGQYQETVCCGDLVGYNPDPAAVLEWTRANCDFVIRGNHDKVVCGLEDLEWFNEVAQTAARWTIDALDDSQISYLRNLEMGPKPHQAFQICHGSPNDEDEYITNPREASYCFPSLADPLIFFGHTHLQGGFFSIRGKIGAIPSVPRQERESFLALEVDTLYMVNPGSVGQPRDGDPRAGYALYDPEKKLVTLRRVEYPIMQTAAGIRQAGLPDVLGIRLFHGL